MLEVGSIELDPPRQTALRQNLEDLHAAMGTSKLSSWLWVHAEESPQNLKSPKSDFRVRFWLGVVDIHTPTSIVGVIRAPNSLF